MKKITLLFIFAVLVTACGGDKKNEMPLPSVGVAKPTIRTVDVERDFVGEVRAVNEAEIRSKVTGRILAVQFREGQLVTAGQALFRLDSDSLQASAREADAGVDNAKALLTKTQADVARYQPLVDKGTISRQQFDAAVAAENQAKAALDAALATQTNVQIMLRESAIVSPYSGRIGRALVNVGALVTAGQTLLANVSTTEAMRVDFALSESDYLELVRPFLEKNASDAARPTVVTQLFLHDGSRYAFDGTITFSDRSLSAQTGTFAVGATFPNPKEILKPGMYGRVRIVVARLPEAMLIPQRALQPVLDKTFVSVLDEQDKVVRKPVITGARIGSEIVIREGLQADDRVIVDGHHKARAGNQVIVKADESSAPAADH